MSSEKSKEKKESKRDEYIKTLENLGITTKGLSDDELLFKVVSELNKSNSLLAEKEATDSLSKYDKYVLGVKHRIKNKDLILRLMKIGVPSFYLHLFEDEDMNLSSDKQLWRIINDSGINPFKNKLDLFRVKEDFKPVRKKMRGFDD